MKRRVLALALSTAVLGCADASTPMAPELPEVQEAMVDIEASSLGLLEGLFADPLVQGLLAALGDEGRALSTVVSASDARTALGPLRVESLDSQADFERAIAVQVLELVVDAGEAEVRGGEALSPR